MAHFGPTRRSPCRSLARARSVSPDFPRAEPHEEICQHHLEANLIKGPRGNCCKIRIEFTDLTGIKVESRSHPGAAAAAKAYRLTSGKPSFDVIHVSYHVQKRQFEKAGGSRT
jgi:multiple sugar transport system substrate-binding protein